MTIPWKPAGEWAGQAVAVIAGGKSMTSEVAESLRQYRTIVADDACAIATWADMLVSVGGNWPQERRGFAGMRVTGVDDDTLDALYVGPMSERITLGVGNEVEVMDSSLAAIRIAADMGANRIILAGFDDDDSPVARGVVKLIAELTILRRHTRRTLERYTPPEKPAAKPVKAKSAD